MTLDEIKRVVNRTLARPSRRYRRPVAPNSYMAMHTAGASVDPPKRKPAAGSARDQYTAGDERLPEEIIEEIKMYHAEFNCGWEKAKRAVLKGHLDGKRTPMGEQARREVANRKLSRRLDRMEESHHATMNRIRKPHVNRIVEHATRNPGMTFDQAAAALGIPARV